MCLVRHRRVSWCAGWIPTVDERLDRVEEIFQVACELPPGERAPYLEAACAGDAALRVDPSRPDEIADALASTVNDPDKLKELSARGLERSKMFSWEKCAHETLEIIEGLDLRGSN